MQRTKRRRFGLARSVCSSRGEISRHRLSPPSNTNINRYICRRWIEERERSDAIIISYHQRKPPLTSTTNTGEERHTAAIRHYWRSKALQRTKGNLIAARCQRSLLEKKGTKERRGSQALSQSPITTILSEKKKRSAMVLALRCQIKPPLATHRLMHEREKK